MQQLPEYDEQLLLQKIAEGNEDAFRQFFSSYSKTLLPFLIKLVKTVAVAEELTQDVLLKVWLHRDQLTEIENLKAWVFRIAANTAYSWLRKMAVEDKALNQQRVHLVNDSLEESFESKQIAEAIQRAVETMPAQRRKIYMLSRSAGLKPSEIAEHLNLSVNTVKNTLTSALNQIRDAIKKDGYNIVSLVLILF